MMIKRIASQLAGVYVAMNSCYDAQGNIDPVTAKELTRFFVSKNVNGLYVGGNTGEGMLQTVDERKKMLESVVEANAGEVNIIAHIGAMTTKDSIELAKHAASVGVDATSSVPPAYYNYQDGAVKQFWLDIMEAADVPFIIYYKPEAAGFRLSTRLLEEILEHPNLAGIKSTTMNLYELQQFKALGGEDFVVFNGPDQLFLGGRSMGADGGIGSTYAVMPELFVITEQYFQNNQLKQAQKWQFIINEILTEIVQIGLLPAIKEIVRLRGVDCGVPRRPLPALNSTEKQQVAQIHCKLMNVIELAEQEMNDGIEN